MMGGRLNSRTRPAHRSLYAVIQGAAELLVTLQLCV